MSLKIQKSFSQDIGNLYVVGTPIGNLADIGERAVEVLSNADIIAAEDTRHTLNMCRKLNINTPLISYHKFNEKARTQQLILKLKEGQNIALVSDAGVPTVSDPGLYLVKEAIENEINVIPVPGPSAYLTALAASGLSTEPFAFIGFLPRSESKRQAALKKWLITPATLLFYESPNRVIKTLTDILLVMGDRKLVVVRELTKKHEEWLRGSVTECLEYMKKNGARGEFTIVLEGNIGPKYCNVEISNEGICQQVDRYIADGYNIKEAIKLVATESGLPKREVYNTYHRKEDEVCSVPEQ